MVVPTSTDFPDALLIALSIVSDHSLVSNDYKGDGIGNLKPLQQWKEEGITGEGVSHMFQRQWKDVMVNMVTLNDQSEIGPIQVKHALT